MIWHNTETDRILKEFNVDETKGLYSGVADERISIYGKNTIAPEQTAGFLKQFAAALNNKFYILLFVISIVSFVLCFVYGEANFFPPVFTVAILVLSALISAYYKHKSINAINGLNGYVNPLVNVLRDGVQKQVLSELLVPGDIIILKEGDFITADARIIECSNFRTNELAVTGEKFEVEKHAGELLEDITPIKKRSNMIYAGSSVSSGTAKAVIVETGRSTEMGKNTEILEQSGSEKLPINDLLEKIEKVLTPVIIVICLILFGIDILLNLHSSLPFAYVTVTMLSDAVALAISAIPESLPAISIIVAALGINRIIENKIMVKRIKVIEQLAKTNVICVDKTGILTKRVMNLTKIYDGETVFDLSLDGANEKTSLILKLSTICSTLDNDSTEQAIENACLEYTKSAKADIENVFPRLAVIPFDTTRKTMTTINMINNAPMAIVKGAPETLIQKCVGADTEQLGKIYNELSAEGLRVLCIAIKNLTETPANPSADEIETDLTFVALLGLKDPPRSGAVEGIKVCCEAGIKPIMITGDSLATAITVARQIGVLSDESQAITGEQLNGMSDDELKANIQNYTVYARITPADKLRIISAWQSKGKIVTVTGDNAEDADALSAADIGCVLGKGGTDVARGTADLVIEENNFKFLVKAIRESRGLFDNIKKSVCYLLGCNLSEILVETVCILSFGFSPLAASQLLLINLLTDCAPSISLATEKSSNAVMKKKPITVHGKLFDFTTTLSIIVYGLFITAMSFISFAIGKASGNPAAITMTFATISMSQIFHSFNMKSEKSLFKCNLKENRFMNYSSVITLFICMFLVLTPAGYVLELTILSAGQFFAALGLALAVIPFGELFKLLLKKLERQ